MLSLFRITEVSAHCDLPCGVYDPAQARIEAESIKAIIAQGRRQRRPRLPHPRDPHQGAALRARQAPPLGAVDRLLQAPALREVPRSCTPSSTRPPSWPAPPAPRASSTPPRPTSCSPRSTRSPRSSGRPRRPDSRRTSRPPPATASGSWGSSVRTDRRLRLRDGDDEDLADALEVDGALAGGEERRLDVAELEGAGGRRQGHPSAQAEHDARAVLAGQGADPG